MLLRLGRRCRRFEPCHSDQRQVAAPNHRGRAEQILAIYHDGEVRILTVLPDQIWLWKAISEAFFYLPHRKF